MHSQNTRWKIFRKTSPLYWFTKSFILFKFSTYFPLSYTPYMLIYRQSALLSALPTYRQQDVEIGTDPVTLINIHALCSPLQGRQKQKKKCFRYIYVLFFTCNSLCPICFSCRFILFLIYSRATAEFSNIISGSAQ